MFDVIVVGGGPGGSIAAKICAESGLHAIILEKKRLPRDKICSGMIMGRLTKGLIAEHFGEIPKDLLTDPPYLSGFLLIGPGIKERIENVMPFLWRKDLDYWMNQRAREKGVEIWDQANVLSVREENGECVAVMEKGTGREEIRSRFVIGADGARSVVRKSLFPNLKAKYTQVSIRECYKGNLGIEKTWYHWVLYKGVVTPRFSVHFKETNSIVVQVALKVGQKLDPLRSEARQYLADQYGFDLKLKPVWRDGCFAQAELLDELYSGEFIPARENTLIIGDAGGMQLPPMGEGIGVAMKTGLLAANAIGKSLKTGKKAADIYLQALSPLLAQVKPVDALTKDAKAESAKGGLPAFMKLLRRAWEESLKVV